MSVHVFVLLYQIYGINILHPGLCVQQINYQDEERGNVLFNDALNTFYLRLYGVGHMVKHHSDSERGNQLMLHFPINSKGSFICTIPHTE